MISYNQDAPKKRSNEKVGPELIDIDLQDSKKVCMGVNDGSDLEFFKEKIKDLEKMLSQRDKKLSLLVVDLERKNDMIECFKNTFGKLDFKDKN